MEFTKLCVNLKVFGFVSVFLKGLLKLQRHRDDTKRQWFEFRNHSFIERFVHDRERRVSQILSQLRSQNLESRTKVNSRHVVSRSRRDLQSRRDSRNFIIHYFNSPFFSVKA